MLKPRSSKLDKAMEKATSYDHWLELANQHDRASGRDRWKGVDYSEDYEFTEIRARLEKLRTMRQSKNNPGLLFVLNEGIHGNFGGMGSEELYNKAKSGTKNLVREYVYEVASSLEYLASDAVDDIELEEKMDFFDRAQHCFGRTALMLSGSGSLLYFHIGVVLALAEQNLIPTIISGASGGSFIGSILCTHTNAELERVFDLEHFTAATRPAEGEQQEGKKATIVDFHAALKYLIPDLTFQEALAKTGRHLNISVASASEVKTSRLLNAQTSPNVFLHEAILASSAIPGIFPAVTLTARNHEGERQQYSPGSQWIDGSLSSDLPTKRLARLYGVNHFIVSQTNPHIVPFVTDAKRKRDTASLLKDASVDTARTWMNTGAAIWKRPLSKKNRVSRVANTVLSILNQNYKGDINIMPSLNFKNLTMHLNAIDQKEMLHLIDMGKRSTWPKMEMIRVQSKVGRTLDDIQNRLHKKLLNQGASIQRGRAQGAGKQAAKNNNATNKSTKKQAQPRKRKTG